MRDDREWLLDIQEAIEKIKRITLHGRQPFLEDEMVQVWIIYHLLVIGEASN